MSVRPTSKNSVALYDSTTMTAFGPIFDSVAAAEDFIDWLITKNVDEVTFKYNNDTVRIMDDPRKHRPDELQHIVQMFRDEQEHQ